MTKRKQAFPPQDKCFPLHVLSDLWHCASPLLPPLQSLPLDAFAVKRVSYFTACCENAVCCVREKEKDLHNSKKCSSSFIIESSGEQLSQHHCDADAKNSGSKFEIQCIMSQKLDSKRKRGRGWRGGVRRKPLNYGKWGDQRICPGWPSWGCWGRSCFICESRESGPGGGVGALGCLAGESGRLKFMEIYGPFPSA